MKNLKLVLFAVIIAFSFTSCELNNESTIDGHDLTTGPRIVGWGKADITENYFEDLGTINKNYPVNILGGADGSSNDKNITYTISVDAAETTAVNNEYTLNSSTGTIASGEVFDNVSIGINTGNFSPAEPTKLVLDVATSVDGVVVSSLAKKMTINFVGCQSEIGMHSYAVTTVREDGSMVDRGIETIITDHVNSFWSRSVGLWTTNDFLNGNGKGVKFEDICGTITIPKHALGDHYTGNEVGGTATTTVDENGNFTLRYYIMFSGEPTKYTSTYTKQ